MKMPATSTNVMDNRDSIFFSCVDCKQRCRILGGMAGNYLKIDLGKSSMLSKWQESSYLILW